MPLADVKKRVGFTLVEMIVSITLIPLIWIGVYIALSANTMFISQAKHRAQAVFLAQQRLDLMRSDAYANLTTTVVPNITIDTRGTAGVGDDLTGTMNVTVVATIPLNIHYRQVTATINWDEAALGGAPRALTESLTTIISDDTAG